MSFSEIRAELPNVLYEYIKEVIKDGCTQEKAAIPDLVKALSETLHPSL